MAGAAPPFHGEAVGSRRERRLFVEGTASTERMSGRRDLAIQNKE